MPLGRRLAVVGLAGLALLLDAPAAQAQTPAPPGDSSQAPPSGARQASPIRFRWEDHPTLRVGRLDVSLRARVQADSRRSDAGETDEEELTLDFARKRVGVEGRFRGYVDFQLERELGSDSDPWRDAYVNYRQFDAVQAQYGKFKIPFGLDENTGATSLDFVYRSLAASTLAPGRDRGYMVHGRLLDGAIAYQAGQFDNDGRNARPKSGSRVYGGQTRVARVVVEPVRVLDAPIEVGSAIAVTDVTRGLSSIRGRTVFGRVFFSSDYPVVGERKRIGFETRFRPGPVQLQAEYIRLTEQRLGESVEDTDLSPIEARGWYVSGSWAVTGDDKSDGLEATRHPLFRGGIGAIEVAARLERLEFDSGSAAELPSASPRADRIIGNANRAQTLGVNWYLNRWIKIQFNLIKETIEDAEQGPLPDQPSFWSRVLRFQFML